MGDLKAEVDLTKSCGVVFLTLKNEVDSAQSHYIKYSP